MPVKCFARAKPVFALPKVTAVRLPQYLDRPQLVKRSGSNRLELSEDHQWGGNLRKNMMRTLSVNLSRLLNTPNVSVGRIGNRSETDYRVEVDIIQFELQPNNEVLLTAQWQISRGSPRQKSIVKISNLSSTIELSTKDIPNDKLKIREYEQLVAAMSILFGNLSRLIAAEIELQSSKTHESIDKAGQ